MEFTSITYETGGHTARITLNRPHRLNAVTRSLYNEMAAAIELAENNGDVRVVVLTGAGRAFCVGADLKEHGSAERTDDDKRDYANAEQEICLTIQQSRKPFLAAVNGYAIGAGAEMALSCDMVLMKESAEIGFPEIRIGTYIGGGLTYMLPRLVGLAKAKELIFLGKRITGQEAQRIGLIYKAVPESQFEASVETLATELAEGAPIPMGLAKEHLAAHEQATPELALAAEADGLLQCMHTDDWKEGVRAFSEKRRPVFRGS